MLGKKEHFAAFLAGFTDAEGSIFCSKKQYYYSLSNYDSEILFFIYKKLNEQGIDIKKPREDRSKGYVSKEGYVRKQNYWHLITVKKRNLIALYNLIYHFMRHKDKLIKFDEAIKDINQRNERFGYRNMGD